MVQERPYHEREPFMILQRELVYRLDDAFQEMYDTGEIHRLMYDAKITFYARGVNGYKDGDTSGDEFYLLGATGMVL